MTIEGEPQSLPADPVVFGTDAEKEEKKEEPTVSDKKANAPPSETTSILEASSLSSFDSVTYEGLAKEEERLASIVNPSPTASLTEIQTEEITTRFQSFVPVRENCHCQWFVDGKDYFAHLADSLELAESEIFITDWSLNPELYLRRDHKNASPDDRLDRILQKKAARGVMVYILVWFETQQAMQGSVNSLHTLEAMESLHPNIRVLRHPGGRTKVYWTHHQKTVVIDQRYAYLGGIDLCFGRWDTSEHSLKDECHLAPLFPGKDYYNPFYQDFTELERPFIDIIDRSILPRMPWHDIHCYVDRDAARDVGLNFIQRWNHHLGKKKSSGEPRVRNYPYLTPGTGPFIDCGFIKGSATCQILRSIGQWSCGLDTERSIQNAYIHLIQNAEHFIYVENQYFISVENSLTETLFQRIAKAIRSKETFRVYILLPVHPCGDWRVPSIRFVMKWQYETISRGGASLLERLAEQFPSVDISQYISFYSLRNVAQLNFTAVSDQIYIHSKLMIVDDRYVIMGSANWNDRSMNGDRDSEIAILVEDNRFIESRMNGHFYMASQFAHTLRKSLFVEHLGLSSEQEDLVIDPVVGSTYNDLWKNTSFANQHLYSSMFPTAPSNNANLDTLAHYNEMEAKLCGLSIERRKEHNLTNLKFMKQIRGHLVPYPTDFLKDEKLDGGATIEKILPPKVFH